MRRAAALAAALVSSAQVSSADPLATVRLVADRAPGAERCADDVSLADAVRARLGVDPFRDLSETRVTVRFSRARHGVRAELRVDRDDVAPPEPRVLRSRRRDCRALSAAVALAVALLVAELPPDAPPVAVVRAVTLARADEPPPIVAATTTPIAAPAPPPPPLASTVAPRAPAQPPWEVHLDLLGAWGVTPAITGGASLGGSWRHGVLSVGVDLRGVLTRAQREPGGAVSVTPFTAAASVCLHRGWLAACGVLSAGATVAEGEGAAINHRVSTPAMRAGARVLLSAPLTSTLSLRVWAELDAAVTVTEHRVDDAVVWTTPPAAASLGAGVGVRIP